jgi:hypothetical protein
VNAPSVTIPTFDDSGGQGSLRLVGPDHYRTANSVGRVGAWPIYTRIQSRERFTPPFTLSGRVKVNARLVDPWIASEQRRPTWNWGVCFHPCYPSNSHNSVVRVSSDDRQKFASGTVEMPDGYAADPWLIRNRTADPKLVGTGWHDFEVSVPRHGHHVLMLDGVIVFEGVESEPTFDGAVPFGFRLDFFDVELQGLRVVEGLEMDPTVLWKHPDYNNVWLVGAGQVVNVSPKMFAYYRNTLKVPLIEERHQGMLDSCVLHSGTPAIRS